MLTFDQATVDASGAFLIGELERLDQGLNLPLVGYTWSRDIQLREDVSIADDISSWTNTTFGAAGTGANPNGKNWIGKDSTAIAGVNVDITKSGNPVNLWGMELGWTVIELQAAQQVGRPIDTQKYDGMQLKWNMDTDEQVYIGDTSLGLNGLVNLGGVALNNAPKTWATSTPDEIRESINAVLSHAWAVIVIKSRPRRTVFLCTQAQPHPIFRNRSRSGIDRDTAQGCSAEEQAGNGHTFYRWCRQPCDPCHQHHDLSAT